MKSNPFRPIRGYTGRFGSGKTYAAIKDVWERSQKEDLPVFSNLSRLIDYRVRYDPFMWDETHRKWGMWLPVNPHGFGEPWSAGVVKDFREILRLDRCIVLIDEMQAWYPSREWNKVGPEVMVFFNQQRKKGLSFVWTSPVNGMVFNQIRDVTSSVWMCQKRFGFSIQERQDLAESSRSPDRKIEKRVVRIEPSYYDLYCSAEQVGNASGEGYSLGESYEGLRPEQIQVGRRKFGHTFGWDGKGTGLAREQRDEFDGREGALPYQRIGGHALPWSVRYRPGDQTHWERELGA